MKEPVDPINDANYYYYYELDDELRGFILRARLEGGSNFEIRVNDPIEGGVD